MKIHYDMIIYKKVEIMSKVDTKENPSGGQVQRGSFFRLIVTFVSI